MLVVVFMFLFVPLALMAAAIWQSVGRAAATVLLRRKWTRAADLGRSIDAAVSVLERLPTPPLTGYRRYTVMLANTIQRVVVGSVGVVGAAGVVLCLSIVGWFVGGGEDDGHPSEPNNHPPAVVFVEDDFDTPVVDDGGEFEEFDSCVGDCTDMDNDGRTWDDVDADGDGLYETP